MRSLEQRGKLEKCKCFSKVHDPQHPTLHLNLYLLHNCAALICNYSAFRLLSVFIAKRQSPASAERATCCLPRRSAFKIPTLHLHQLSYIRGPQHHFHSKTVAGFEPFDSKLSASSSLPTSISQPLPPDGTRRQSSEKYYLILPNCSFPVTHSCSTPHLIGKHVVAWEHSFRPTYYRLGRLSHRTESSNP